MNENGTGKIFEDYNTGAKNLEETNEALKKNNAGYHLESLTEEERAEKKRREDIAGTVENKNPPETLPQNVNMKRRTDLIGKPASERKIIQRTAHGKFLVEYDDQGYAISASRYIPPVVE